MSREGGRRVRKHRNGANRWDGTRKNSCCGYLVYLVAYKKLHGVGITINWHDHLQDLNNRPLTFIKDQTRFFLVSLWKTEANPESHRKQPPSRTRPYLRKWRAGEVLKTLKGYHVHLLFLPSPSRASVLRAVIHTEWGGG